MDAAVQSKSSATILFFFRRPSYHNLVFKGSKKKRKNDKLLGIQHRNLLFSILCAEAASSETTLEPDFWGMRTTWINYFPYNLFHFQFLTRAIHRVLFCQRAWVTTVICFQLIREEELSAIAHGESNCWGKAVISHCLGKNLWSSQQCESWSKNQTSVSRAQTSLLKCLYTQFNELLENNQFNEENSFPWQL